MRNALLATVAAVACAHAAPARAQWLVSDPLTESSTVGTLAQEVTNVAQGAQQIVNQGTQITQGVTTIKAILHGDLYAASSLLPELEAMGVIDPLGVDAQTFAQGLAGMQSVGSFGQQFLSQVQAFKSQQSDYRAQALNRSAISVANQLGAATQLAEAARSRQTALPGIVNMQTVDLKDSTDKTARLAGEAAIGQAQANQIAAFQMLQQAQQAAAAARDQQMWRCSSEQLALDAQAAASSGGSGPSLNCSMPIAPSGGVPVSEAAPVGGSVQLASANAGDLAAAGGDGGVLGAMTAQSWGAQAAANASAIGVNPSALAATCVLESGCTNVGAQPGSTVSGPFQMTDGTYNADLNSAASQNPALAASVVGKADPATESIAASQDLKNAAISLQGAGIANPTVLDARAYYNFGAGYGTAVATAPPTANLSSILSSYTPAQLQANGVSPTETVGQWRAAVTSKLGAGAMQPVLGPATGTSA